MLQRLSGVLLYFLLWIVPVSAAQDYTLSPEPVEMIPAGESASYTLSIPAAGIHTPLTSFYLDGTSWAIDPWEPLAGHLQGTAFPGGGNAVIAGHSEHPNGTPGIFGKLSAAQIGDRITILEGIQERHFVIVDIRSVDYRDLSILYPTPFNRLTLITCDIPSWVAAQNIYYARLVIIADELDS